MEKVTLNQRLAVDDGFLHAHVNYCDTTIQWESKEGPDHQSEELIWTYSALPSTTIIVPKSELLPFERERQIGDVNAYSSCALVSREPYHLLGHKERFTGIHPNIDRMLAMYEAGAVQTDENE